jgi:nucleoside-diphosphate-sugar epimerase
LQDLANAFVKVLANEKAYGQVYNISGSKYVTFDGIAKACAKVCPVIRSYPENFQQATFDDKNLS